MWKSWIRLPFLLAGSLALVGCGGAGGGGGGDEPGIAFSVSPLSAEVVQGGSQAFTITATPTGGFAAALSVSASVEPAAAGITWGPMADWAVSGSQPVQRTVTVEVAADVAPGDYSVTIELATGGTVQGTLVLPLAIAADDDTDPGPADPGVRIAIGATFALLLDASGQLWVWGSNLDGALTLPIEGSEGGVEFSAAPVPVTGLPDGVAVLDIAAGDEAAFALLEDGSVWSWGVGGILGRSGSAVANPVPGPVSIMSGTAIADFERFAAQSSTAFGWRQDTGLWAWGRNDVGQMGHATSNSTNTPTQVLPDLDHDAISHLSIGAFHVVARMTDGTVRSWGAGDSRQLGDGVTHAPGSEYYTPEPVTAGIAGVDKLSAGGYHTLALLEDGTVWSWGYPGIGDVVLGHDGDGWSPAQVPLDLADGSRVQDIAAGASHSLVLLDDGRVLAWGRNPWGQLGDGTTVHSALPVGVDLVGPADAIYTSPEARFSLALLEDGSLWGWGEGYHGVLGELDPEDTPSNDLVARPVQVIGDVHSIAGGTE